MDLREINYNTIPTLKKKLFPTMLMGELASYRIHSDGVLERVNKDKGKGDSDYEPNKVVNVIPNENLNEAKEYFELSNFSKAQIEYIFKKLDLELVKFKDTELKSFISYDSKVNFSELEDEVQGKFEGIIDSYLKLKNIVMTPSEISLDDLVKEQNLLITHVDIQSVYNHFKELTSTTNKHNKFYLTNKQLLKFIHSTFVSKEPVKQDFNCKIVKKDIRKIFHAFYVQNASKDIFETNLKRKYFDIMDKSFNGFNENDYNDFHK